MDGYDHYEPTRVQKLKLWAFKEFNQCLITRYINPGGALTFEGSMRMYGPQDPPFQAIFLAPET